MQFYYDARRRAVHKQAVGSITLWALDAGQ